LITYKRKKREAAWVLIFLGEKEAEKEAVFLLFRGESSHSVNRKGGESRRKAGFHEFSWHFDIFLYFIF
jgi:hypothetical protein